MALSGTIRDFALPDIFQLIGIQRKTGVLTLENGSEMVTLRFLEGQVVGADTRGVTLEDRLGTLLVRTGRITEAQLQEALRQQKNTLQRLGHILVSGGFISEEDLVDALRVQSTQIIYRLFRWREGTYRFAAVDDLDYDQKHFKPISSETILMEGARMIDEWPIIERRVRSPRMILRRTEAAEGLLPGSASLVDPDVAFDMGFDYDRPGAGRGEAPAKLSAEEQAILALVNGRRTVEEICDLSIVGEFDCYRILSDLLTRKLLEEVPRTADERERSRAQRLLQRALNGAGVALLGVAAAVALLTLPANPLTPWRLLEREPVREDLRLFTSLARLERIERALQIHYLDSAAFPEELGALAERGYLPVADLSDAWGAPFRYQLSAGGYRIEGTDGQGRVRSGLAVSRQFQPVQRMMLAGEAVLEP